MHVILIGPMGSGKSTIGRHLAARLRVPFADLDDVIVQRAGKSIPDIFAEDGECVFRALEGEELAEACANHKPQVIGTGGGIVMSAPNRERMKKAGRVIWLDASPEILADRIRGDANRPLLKGVDPLVKSRELHRKRSPLYEECANLKACTGETQIEEAVDTIMAFLSELGPVNANSD